MTELDLGNIMSRVEALERQNCRLRWIALGLAFSVVSGVCLSFVNRDAEAAAPAPKAKPSMEKMVLCDEFGKERIVLKADKDHPMIQILSSAGKPVVQIGSARGSYIHFCDSKGIPHLELAAGDTWSVLRLLDENSVTRTEISAAGKELLLLSNEKGRRILEVAKEGPSLTLFDKDGKPVFTKP